MGKKLINLCKEYNLRIINGRCLGDSFGQCTFFRQGVKSLIDYTVTSDFFFDKISGLIIKPLTYFSDHCQVVTIIVKFLQDKKKYRKRRAKISADISARLFRVTCNKVSGILTRKD